MSGVRNPVVAGSFYPSTKENIESQIEEFIENIPASVSEMKVGKVKLAVVPHAGYEYSGLVATATYEVIKKSWKREVPEKIVVIGVSHQVPFSGISVSTDEKWIVPNGSVDVDTTAVGKLLKTGEFVELGEAFTYEHSLEVQLPFLVRIFEGFKLIPLCCGFNVDHKDIANDLNSIVDDKTLVVTSSDLSHYHTYSEAVKLDNGTIDSILKSNKEGLSLKDREACGKEGILVGMELAKINKWKPKLVMYNNSGDVTGDKGAVVGYAGIIYE